MGKKMQPHENRSNERSSHLRDDVRGDLRKLTGFHRKSKGYSRVDVSITASARNSCKNSRHNRECPAACDYHPACSLRFRMLQQDVCDYSIPKQYQHERTHEFAKTLRQHQRLPFFDSESKTSSPTRTSALPPASKGCTFHLVFRFSGLASRCGRPSSLRVGQTGL